MRKTLTSIAVVGAAGALLAAGGAYSVFNDAGASVGGLTAGTVKLSVTGQVPATDIFALSGVCTTRYQDNNSPTDALNMGTVNNTGCVSHFTVHNAGSLPFELSGTTVSDTNPVGLTCVTSTITDGIAKTAALLPGADRVVSVSTKTVNDVAGCQNLTDKVAASLVATETRAQQCSSFTSLTVPVPSGATQWCDTQPVSKYSPSQAKIACETFYGSPCSNTTGDCAGDGYGPISQQYGYGRPTFGYADGCSGSAGRMWQFSSSYTTYGYWAK